MTRALLTLLFLLTLTTPVGAEVRRLEVPGGWYGDARVGGERVALVSGSHIDTHQGRIPLPDGINVLFLDLCPSGAFEFGGQDHSGRGNLVWRDGNWSRLGDSYGVNPVLCDSAHRWHQATPFHGSQGLRYEEGGRVFTGDETYFSPALGLWEYTCRGDICVGQGLEGCVASRAGTRYRLHSGDCRFVRFDRAGEALAITFVPPGRTIHLWLEARDLASFPLDTPGDPGGEEPEDPPAPSCGQIPDRGKAALQRLREKFISEITSRDDEQRRVWAMRAAEQLRFLLGDTWGTKRADPGRPLSKDAVARKTEGAHFCNYDIVNGDTRQLQFGEGELLTDQVFVPVRAFDYLGDEDPDDPDDPPPPSCEACEANLAKALAQVAAVTRDRDAALGRIGVLEGELRALDAKHAETLLELDRVRKERDKALAVSCRVVGGFGPFRGRCELVR